jgi:hypothetical protein
VRIAITQIDLLLDWIRSNPDPVSARRIVKKVLSQGVLVGEISRQNLASVVSEVEDSISFPLMEALVEATMISRAEGNADTEKPFRKRQLPTFVDLIESEEWDLLYSHRTRFIPERSGRDQELGRVLGRTLTLPEGHLELLDKFLGEKILKRESVISWFFSFLQNRKINRVVFITKTPKAWGKSKREPLENFISVLDQLVTAAGFEGQVIVEFNHEISHDRYWAYQFTEGILTFTNGYGLDAFRNDQMVEPTTLQEVAQELWFQLRSGMRGGTKIEPYVQQKSLASNIEIRIPSVWQL